MQPFPFQAADVRTLRDNNYTGLQNIEPGGGKTPLSAFAMKDSGSNVNLVVAPLNTHANAWGKTIPAILGHEARAIGNGSKDQRRALFDFEMGYPGTYLITPQLFTRMDISDWRADMAIVDEIHMLNKPKSKGQEQLDALAQRSGMRMALSGTPARRAFERNWSNMRFVWPYLNRRGEVAYDNHFVWMRDRMVSEDIFTGLDQYGRPKTAKKWLAEAEPGRLFSEAPCVIQHFRRDQCCHFHPEGFLPLEEPQVIEHVVSLHSKQKKAINELETQYLAWLDENPLVAELTITQQQRIRQVCLAVPTLTFTEDEDGEVKTEVNFESDAVSPFADEVEAILEKLPENEPVVIYLESQRYARVLTERLNKSGYSAAEFSGKTVKERSGYLERFGKDIQVIVGVISAIGTGTDGIQNVSNTEIWIERSVDDTANEQSESRQDRLGAKGQVQRYVIRDDLGYAEGRLNDQLTKRLAIQKSTRKAV